MKIIITGAAGFIGSHLAKFCLEQGHEVHMMDNNWTNNEDGYEVLAFESEGKYHIYDIDVADRRHNEYQGLEALFSKIKPDVCYHLAAYASESRSNHIRSFIHQNNTVGTANIINACVNHGTKLIFSSSVAVMSGRGPYHEGIQPNPIDSYGLSKWMSELEIQIAAETQGLKYTIIRPRNVMGPGQNIWDPSRNLWGIWMYNALHNKPCLIFGDGNNVRDFTYIDDLIHALYKAKDVHGFTINVGAEKGYSLNEASYIFQRVTGYTEFQYADARHEVKVAHCYNDLAKQVLNYQDTVDLEEGVRRMWEWAKLQPDRPLDVPPPLEVEINAHSSLK